MQLLLLQVRGTNRQGKTREMSSSQHFLYAHSRGATYWARIWEKKAQRHPAGFEGICWGATGATVSFFSARSVDRM